jgi:hypothetical protein
MAEYRAYVVGNDGRFASCEAFTCDDDNEAVARAKRLVGCHDVELWSGERFIVRLSPEDAGPRNSLAEDK